MGRHRAEVSRAHWKWCGWRPRRLPPGTTWISSKRYIALLEGALHAARLELEIVKVRAETQSLEAEARAHDVLVGLPIQAKTDLLDAIPMTSDGQLHERALFALLDQNADFDRLLAG